ncbi:MAG TPA: bifunctional alpha/beta hydrolase/OsmC family protein [Allosphingosinicella sp.]|nr:bifunctional alpha/beta hydrolase/OsmC family protein [Allosphingosinicella sp.]
MRSLPFDFTGESGQRLAGRLDLPEGPVAAHVLFAHCFTCSKNSIAAVRVARALTSRGYGVLRFDFTGLGDSGGDLADSGFSGSVRDLVAAAAALRDAGRPPAILIGHSLGGAAALAAAGDIPEIVAVATIAAPMDADHVMHLLSGGLDEVMAQGEAEVRIGGRPFTIRRSFVEDLAAQDQKPRISGLRRALLILHSPQDATVGIDNATRIFVAARHPKSFVSLDGADHLLTSAKDADYVAEIVTAWASRYLPAGEPLRSDSQSGFVSVEETGEGAFQVEVRAGGARFVADEPVEVGGLGSGPTPYDLLAAGLGACTAMTLRLYARGKKLALDRVKVKVGHSRTAEGSDLFVRRVELQGELSPEQRARLIEIAERCPVHKTLEKGAAIETAADEEPKAAVEQPTQHARDMEQACDRED